MKPDSPLLGMPLEEMGDLEPGELSNHFLATAYLPAMKARAELQSARAERNRIMDGLEAISVMRETEEPRPAYILNRGSYDARGRGHG